MRCRCVVSECVWLCGREQAQSVRGEGVVEEKKLREAGGAQHRIYALQRWHEQTINTTRLRSASAPPTKLWPNTTPNAAEIKAELQPETPYDSTTAPPGPAPARNQRHAREVYVTPSLNYLLMGMRDMCANEKNGAASSTNAYRLRASGLSHASILRRGMRMRAGQACRHEK